MALYGYFKQGFGLFLDAGSGDFENSDTRVTVSEDFLISNAFQKLTAYSIINSTWEFDAGAAFAQQPDSPLVHRLIDSGTPKFIDSSYMTNATYFTEIQYAPEYIL